MFILTVEGKESEGAYSVIDEDGDQILYLFEGRLAEPLHGRRQFRNRETDPAADCRAILVRESIKPASDVLVLTTLDGGGGFGVGVGGGQNNQNACLDGKQVKQKSHGRSIPLRLSRNRGSDGGLHRKGEAASIPGNQRGFCGDAPFPDPSADPWRSVPGLSEHFLSTHRTIGSASLIIDAKSPKWPVGNHQ